jgi:CheY-like chemotaxis protein
MAKLVRGSAKSGRILLADDEEMVRKAIRLILNFGGYQIVEAVDGEDAVEKYLEASPPFDLILIDLDMPRLGGADALARIRRHHPEAKAIFLSGGVHSGGLERSIFLQKPFDNQELIGLVRNTLEPELQG